MKSKLAISSFVIGLIAIAYSLLSYVLLPILIPNLNPQLSEVVAYSFYAGPLISVVGIIIGIISLKKVKSGNLEGKNFAILGIIFSIIGLFLSIVFIKIIFTKSIKS